MQSIDQKDCFEYKWKFGDNSRHKQELVKEQMENHKAYLGDPTRYRTLQAHE